VVIRAWGQDKRFFIINLAAAITEYEKRMLEEGT
jgi:hypothetical protein